MPRTVPDEEDKVARLDHDLQPDEQAYVRHYVNYADVLLDQEQPATSESGNNLVEMPRQNGDKASSETQDDHDGHEAA